MLEEKIRNALVSASLGSDKVEAATKEIYNLVVASIQDGEWVDVTCEGCEEKCTRTRCHDRE